MLFRYALRSMRKYLLGNALTVMQLAAVLCMTAFMISSVSLRLARWAPFRDEFSGSGRLVVFTSFAHNGDLTGNFSMVNTNADMSALLGTEVKALGTHMCSADIKDGLDGIVLRSADRELINRYSPELKAGEWFKGSGLCAAVTEGCGYSLGDRIVIGCDTREDGRRELTAEVTAVISGKAKLAGFAGENDGPQAETFELFYRCPEEDSGTRGVVLLDDSALPEDMVRAYAGAVLLSYPEGADEEQITELLRGAGSVFSISMPALEEASRSYLALRVRDLLPLTVILCVMALVSSISTAALSTRQQLRDYAVLSLCGLRKGRCVVIGLMQNAVCLCLAGAVSAAGAALIRAHWPESLYLHLDVLLLAGEAAIGALFLLVSLAAPALMIGRSRIQDVLGSE
ncbi:MAG: hypothetical protein IJ746_02655 [Ruminococcus sp.]|nr:hypothetical protein [Ruminococcus sp.]